MLVIAAQEMRSAMSTTPPEKREFKHTWRITGETDTALLGKFRANPVNDSRMGRKRKGEIGDHWSEERIFGVRMFGYK
jgi:hypothetical protein